MTAQTAKTEKLNLRLSLQAKQMLRIAALAARRSVSEFVLESALARAEETLVDRPSFYTASYLFQIVWYKPVCTLNPQFIKHIVCIFADDEITFGISCFHCTLGGGVGNNHVERKTIAKFNLFIKHGDSLCCV